MKAHTGEKIHSGEKIHTGEKIHSGEKPGQERKHGSGRARGRIRLKVHIGENLKIHSGEKPDRTMSQRARGREDAEVTVFTLMLLLHCCALEAVKISTRHEWRQDEGETWALELHCSYSYT